MPKEINLYRKNNEAAFVLALFWIDWSGLANIYTQAANAFSLAGQPRATSSTSLLFVYLINLFIWLFCFFRGDA